MVTIVPTELIGCVLGLPPGLGRVQLCSVRCTDTTDYTRHRVRDRNRFVFFSCRVSIFQVQRRNEAKPRTKAFVRSLRSSPRLIGPLPFRNSPHRARPQACPCCMHSGGAHAACTLGFRSCRRAPCGRVGSRTRLLSPRYRCHSRLSPRARGRSPAAPSPTQSCVPSPRPSPPNTISTLTTQASDLSSTRLSICMIANISCHSLHR